MIKDKTNLFLKAWHRTAKEKNLDHIDSLIVEEVVLFSPAFYKPKIGKNVVYGILRDVLASFDHYKVTKTWIDGHDVILEFDAIVNHKKIQGIDKITLNDEGKLIQLKVFIRPFSGIKALIASIVAIEMARVQKNMSSSQKLMSKTLFILKSKWNALTKS